MSLLRQLLTSPPTSAGIPTDAYRKSHEIEGSTEGAQTDYQVKVNIHRSIGTDSEEDVYLGVKCREDFGDIRFTKSDGITELDYWLEGTETRQWNKYAENPILSPEGAEVMTTFGSVLKVDETYHMYYQYGASGAQKIGHATSADGKSWTKDAVNNPVLEPSGAGWDSKDVRVPMVWKEGATWYMIYSGRVIGDIRIGLATSSDGLDWDKSASNPVFSGAGWCLHDAENWGLMKVDSTYYLWFSTLYDSPRSSGLITSTNLIDWTEDANNPLFGTGRFCPFPFKRGDYYYLLVPRYTVGTNYGEMELYRDSNPTFHVGDRTLVGIAFQYGDVGEWDHTDIDTPCILTDDINRNSYTVSDDELWCYYAGHLVDWKTGLIIEGDVDCALNLSELTVGAFWVEVDSIPADPDSATIYVYYGKADEITTSSMADTFIDSNPMETLAEFDARFTKVSGSDRVLDEATYDRTVIKLPDISAAVTTSYIAAISFPTNRKYAFRYYFAATRTGVKYPSGGFWVYGNGNATILFFAAARSGDSALKTLFTGAHYTFGTFLEGTLNWWEVIVDGANRLVLNVEVEDGDDYTTDRAFGGAFDPDTLHVDCVGSTGVGDGWFGSWYIREYVSPEPAHGDWGAEEPVMWPF